MNTKNTGIILIVIGMIMMIYTGFNYVTTKKVVDLGPIEINKETNHPVPLVADYSSIILAEPLDVSKFGLIYAGAQKNIGPAGLVVVIVREDLLGDVIKGTPTMLDYKIHADNASMYNTPSTYAWYLSGLVPEQNIVGKPLFIFFSRYTNQFGSTIRWDRIFTSANRF